MSVVGADGRSIDLDTVHWEQLVEAGNRPLATCRTQAPRPADPGGDWSLEADAKLKALWAEELSMDELIMKLDRNSGAIERRLFKLAIVISRRQVLERQVRF